MEFNPDDTGIANGNFFGFPFTIQQAQLVLLRVPWDVTVSYRDGTAEAPQAIIEASTQVEIYDAQYGHAWRQGIATAPVERFAKDNNDHFRKKAAKIISQIEQGHQPSTVLLSEVNAACAQLNDSIYKSATSFLEQGKLVGLIGGDHSTPLGLIRALSERHPKMGILHIDAHSDLRVAYEGFTYSHASIMYNVLKTTNIERLTQVAIRDFCTAELSIVEHDKRVVQFTDLSLQEALLEGATWSVQCAKIVATLPQEVYISLDIDGLEPTLCPNTGTPVAGGLTWHQTLYLLCQIKHSGRRVVGFDLVEVAPSTTDDQWDANVGARLLYKLCLLALQK